MGVVRYLARGESSGETRRRGECLLVLEEFEVGAVGASEKSMLIRRQNVVWDGT